MHLEGPLVPNLYLPLKSKRVLFEIYHFYTFALIKLPYITIEKADVSFRILKFSENLKSTSLDQVRNETLFFEWIREKKVVNKFTKLSKIGFCMECFTAGFLCVFHKKHQNLAFGYLARYSPSNSGIPTTFLKFPNFLRS